MKFGVDYEPSTKATREEAPSISRPTILTHSPIGRQIHCMGQPEVHAAILALHHPALVDLHEQKMLSPFPTSHPLTGLPGFANANLPFVRGTLDVATRLNCRQLHPKLWLVDPETKERAPVAFPYQGDLLLFLEFEGCAYAINWTVKKKATDFLQPQIGSARTEKADRARRLRRYQIEDIYYSDVGVITIAVSEDKMNANVSLNLKAIYPYTKDALELPKGLRSIVVRAFNRAREDGMPPNEVMARMAYDGVADLNTTRTIFFQAIWTRQLRVDLFTPVIIDAPMKEETVDVFNYYKDWFPDPASVSGLMTADRCSGM